MNKLVVVIGFFVMFFVVAAVASYSGDGADQAGGDTELSDDEYRSLWDLVDEHDELRPLLNDALYDGVVTHSELAMIRKQIK